MGKHLNGEQNRNKYGLFVHELFHGYQDDIRFPRLGTIRASLFWGCAETRNPTTGKIEPASNSWVANGYNWTGTLFQDQYFWLIYGNGSDFLPKSKKDVSGWNILNQIDPEDDK